MSKSLLFKECDVKNHTAGSQTVIKKGKGGEGRGEWGKKEKQPKNETVNELEGSQTPQVFSSFLSRTKAF